MVDDPGTEPEPNTPARSSRKYGPVVWVSLALSIVSILLAGVGPLLFFGLSFLFDGADEGEIPDGDDYSVTQRSVVNAVEEPCRAMHAAGERITPYAPIPQAKRELHAWADSAGAIAKAIDGADPTGDSLDWRDDWNAVSEAVHAYADQLGTGTKRLNLPANAQEMSWASDEDCSIPLAIAVLDPGLAEEISL